MLLKIRPLFHHLLTSTAGRTLLLSLFIWLVAFTYCKNTYYREPHSAFFKSEHAYDLKYSLFREEQANSFINSVSNTTVAKAGADEVPEICAAFTTVRREGKQYINAAVGSLLEGLTESERSRLYLYVLFANTVPEVHETWNASWLRSVADEVGSYDVSAEELQHLKELEEKRDYREKGVYDYVYLLDKCYETHAPYILILEGDVIVADGWMAKTRQALRKIEYFASDPKGKFANWLYLRLFYTETFLIWGPDHFWYKNSLILVLLGVGFGYFSLRGMQMLFPQTRRVLDGNTVVVVCLITIPAFIALGFMLGPYNFLPSEVFLLNHNGCCSQAVLFPRDQVPEMVKYLRKEKTGAQDIMIEDYADMMGKNRLALKKQVVQHVGLVSSRGNGHADVNTRDIWAFWFEDYDPIKLRKEHERLTHL